MAAMRELKTTHLFVVIVAMLAVVPPEARAATTCTLIVDAATGTTLPTHGERTLVFTRLIEDDQPEKIRAAWRARDGFFADWPALVASIRAPAAAR